MQIPYHENRLSISQENQLIERAKYLRRWLMDRRDDRFALQCQCSEHLDQ